MARVPADIRISSRKREQPTDRIELIRTFDGRRYRIRRNGTKSKKLPEATASQIAEALRKWLVSELKAPLGDCP